MTFKRCDRCGKEYHITDFTALPVRVYRQKNMGDLGKMVDLCEECTNELDQWLDEFDTSKIDDSEDDSADASALSYWE